MRTSRFLLLLAIGAVVGFSIFGVMVWRAVDVEEMPAPDALRRFAEARGPFAGVTPILELDDHGRLVRRARPAPEDAARPHTLRVLAYRAADRRLIRADVPFWFFELKGPAIEYALAGTGLDLERLGVTPGELKRYGPTLVIDHTGADGDRLLVWTD
jgi:hypothetical protein